MAFLLDFFSDRRVLTTLVVINVILFMSPVDILASSGSKPCHWWDEYTGKWIPFEAECEGPATISGATTVPSGQRNTYQISASASCPDGTSGQRQQSFNWTAPITTQDVDVTIEKSISISLSGGITKTCEGDLSVRVIGAPCDDARFVRKTGPTKEVVAGSEAPTDNCERKPYEIREAVQLPGGKIHFITKIVFKWSRQWTQKVNYTYIAIYRCPDGSTQERPYVENKEESFWVQDNSCAP